MALTGSERRRLKSLLGKAELDFCCPHCGVTTPIDDRLIELSPALKKHDHGAPKKGNDEIFLEGLECNVRIIMKQAKLERGPAILRQAESIMRLKLKDKNGRQIAKNPEALAKRWERKLRKRGFKDRPDETLKAQGVLIPLLGLSRPISSSLKALLGLSRPISSSQKD
jgi:hypothetical protein